MDKQYEMRILLNPHSHDNKSKPYFWCILKWDDEIKNWENNGHGWSESIENAFKDAMKYYTDIKEPPKNGLYARRCNTWDTDPRNI